MEQTLHELGSINLAIEPEVPIWILSREGRGDGSSNWVDNNRPGLSVFTSEEKLVAVLMKEDSMGRLGAKRIIKYGGMRQSENQWLRIERDVLDPDDSTSDHWHEWELKGADFMTDPDLAGAEEVALEFMYLKGLYPVGPLKFKHVSYSRDTKESKCQQHCVHPYWEVTRPRESWERESDVNTYVTCVDDCGLKFRVETMKELPKWSQYRKEYRGLIDYAQVTEKREEQAQRYWTFSGIDEKFSAVHGTCYITQREAVKVQEGKQADWYTSRASEPREVWRQVGVGKLVLDAGILTAVKLDEADTKMMVRMGFRVNPIITTPMPAQATLHIYNHDWRVRPQLGKPLPVWKEPSRSPRWVPGSSLTSITESVLKVIPGPVPLPIPTES